MPFTNRTCMKRTGELIDFLGGWLRRFIRKQLVEMDRHRIAVPLVGGRESDGDTVGHGAEHKGFTVGWWKRPFLASQKAIRDFLAHISEERALRRQSPQKYVRIPESLHPQVLRCIEPTEVGKTERFVICLRHP